jgi:hypothetical protein
MANVKLTELAALLASNTVDADVVMIVDVDADTSNKMLVSELRSLMTNALVIGVDVQAYSAILAATTASYTTALDTKLGTIETSADVTDVTNVTAAGAVMDSDYTPAFSFLVQQSGTGSPSSLSIAAGTIVGRITGGGSEIDDLSPTQVRLLLNVEDGADVTDTTNVTAAGALMDSEVTNLAQVKAFDSTDYAAALGADDNYVTDAEKIVIGNTSGTNTGDQDLSVKQDILSEGAFVNGDKTKLDGIETGADVTDATNVSATGAVIPTGTPDGTKFLRDDQVWTAVPGGGDALTANPLSQFAATTSLQLLGVISDETGTGALVFGTSPTLVTPNLGTPTTLVGTNITGTAAGLTVGATTGVEAGADVTDTTNVTAAGALMDTEVTNLAQVKAFDTTDYATSVQGTTADNALPKTGGAMTGAITTISTFDGRDVATDGTKLDGIEALADVTDATNIASSGGVIPTGTPDGSKFLRDDQVWTAIPAGGDALTSNPLSQFAATTSAQLLGVVSDETGTGALVFGTSPTLVTPNLGTPSTLVGTNITGTAAGLTVGATTGVEAGADVGALMDSEVINLAQVKAFDTTDYATAAQGITAEAALPKTGGAMTGAITTTSTFDGRDVATDGTKLDGIEALADVTDATNVTAAGALMDSELTSIADIKALNQSVVSGAAPVFDATNMTNIPATSPAGSTTQLQFNDAGAFGASSGATYSNGLTLTAVASTHKPLILKVASGQSANAFEINSFGGSGGDLLGVNGAGYASLNVAPSTGARLDIIQAWSSATAALRFGSTTANATTKLGRITCRHYTNAQKDVILFFGDVNATRNIMKFGGGSSYGNAATNIVFMTGANTTAGTGNLTMEVTDGKVGINTATTASDYDSATAALDIDADLFRLRQSKTPSSASDTGDVGSICWDSGYIYICTATNTWERAAIATW